MNQDSSIKFVNNPLNTESNKNNYYLNPQTLKDIQDKIHLQIKQIDTISLDKVTEKDLDQ